MIGAEVRLMKVRVPSCKAVSRMSLMTVASLMTEVLSDHTRVLAHDCET